ncbi:MAG TPA: glutaredoxin domain-containing protein [Thermoanaerobaculia bacterium]|jgi:glutaredoxin
MAGQVKIYGADWCGDTRRALRVLDTTGVKYDYINIDDDADGEKKVIAFNNGKRRIPLVEIASEKGTQSLSVPSDSELEKALH